MSTISSSDALQVALTVTAVCTYLPVLAGAWKIMRVVRTVSSRTLFIPLAALPFWIPFQHVVLGGMSTIDTVQLRQVMNWMSTGITCLLFVIPAISFLLVSRHVVAAMRPVPGFSST